VVRVRVEWARATILRLAGPEVTDLHANDLIVRHGPLRQAACLGKAIEAGDRLFGDGRVVVGQIACDHVRDQRGLCRWKQRLRIAVTRRAYSIVASARHFDDTLWRLKRTDAQTKLPTAGIRTARAKSTIRR